MISAFVFYTYQNQIELGGELFSAGQLSLEILNLTPEQFSPLGALAEELHTLCCQEPYPALLRELNEKCREVHTALRQLRVLGEAISQDDRVFDPISLDKGRGLFYENERDALLRIAEAYRQWVWEIAAFNTVIRRYIDLAGKTAHADPEANARTLHFLYHDERLFEKIILPTLQNGPVPYTFNDNDYTVALLPREKPDGKFAVCQRMETNSLQAVLKADFFLALNAGYNVRRCIICGRYFLLKSAARALYCEGACPHAPRFTCRQFGAHEVQKELARDIPKLKVKERAFARINKDRKRENITGEEARAAKDYVRDRLYDALRSPAVSVEEFEGMVSSQRVYGACGIQKAERHRGRPRKQHG